MENQSGPISITALLAASNSPFPPQQNPTTYQQQPTLPPLPPRPPQQAQKNMFNPQINVPKLTQQTVIQQTAEQPQTHSQYYVSNYPIQQEQHQLQRTKAQFHQNTSPPVSPTVLQFPSGYHVLSHHNPNAFQPVQQPGMMQHNLQPRKQQITTERLKTQHAQQNQQQVSKIYELIQQQVSYSRPTTTPIMAKPQLSPQFSPPNNQLNIDDSRSKNTSHIRSPTPSNIPKFDDKLLDKIQQMQVQITKLSRAIIKKDNQQLHTELSLNQIIQQKDRILEKKNRELQASTRRIKLLIEESENKDLQIQRLKLEIERVQRINNVSFDMSKMEEVEIRNDSDNVLTSAYYKDLVSESQFPNRYENSIKNQMIPTKETTSNRIQNIQEGLVSPTLIDLRYAKPAGDANIYQLSGNRKMNNYY